MQWSFGPVVFVPDETGIPIAKCLSGGIACRGYTGGRCHWNGEPQKINEDNTTPDWCKYKDNAMADAKEMMENESND